MQCPACSQSTSPDFQFCTQCGTDIGPTTYVRRRVPQHSPGIIVPVEQAIKSKPPFLTIFGFATGVLCAGLIAGGVFGLMYLINLPSAQQQHPTPPVQRARQQRTTKAPPPETTPAIHFNSTPTPIPTPPPIVIVDESFIVDPNGYKAKQVNVIHPARLHGSFIAEGGERNDIQCLIMDQDSFMNWRNGHSTLSYYNSQKTTVGNIDLRLGPGLYYLVFNNKFSFLSNKAIKASIYLESL